MSDSLVLTAMMRSLSAFWKSPLAFSTAIDWVRSDSCRAESSSSMSNWPFLTRVPSSITHRMVVAYAPREPALTRQTTSLFSDDSSVPRSTTVTWRYSRLTVCVIRSGRLEENSPARPGMCSVEPTAGTRATAPPTRTTTAARVAPQVKNRRRCGLPAGGGGPGLWVGEPLADAGVKWTGWGSGRTVGGVGELWLIDPDPSGV